MYPSTTAHQYWLNTSFTSFGSYTRSLAGRTSNTYYWPLPFDVPAHFAALGKTINGIVIKSAILRCKVDADSNSFTSGEYLGVGISTGSCYTSVAACRATADGGLRENLGNEHVPAGGGNSNIWDAWDVVDAVDVIRSGACYLVMYGNEYGVLYNNHGNVAEADRVYLEIEYEEGTLGYEHSDGLHRAQVIYKHSDGLHLCQPFYMDDDGLHEISI